ncbi:MAG: hypothetical protein WKF96_16545 [Solirubrobacteraceae bacterium]
MAGPTKEQRIAAAMALAGVDFKELARRIATKNYGARTLQRIANADDVDRPPRGPDLVLIGAACGVSDAFWTIDFSELEEPSLHDEVSRQGERLALLALTVDEHTQELRALRDQGHETG